MQISATNEQFSKVKLMVATPAYGGNVHVSFTKSMIDLVINCIKYGIHLEFYFLGNESLITRARNYAADHFLRSSCTHLMFIDSDIGFSAESILQLLAITIMDPEKYKILGGAYPKKSISWEKIKFAVDKGVADVDPNILEKYVGDYVFNPKATGEVSLAEPIEISELGTGFMMITRDVFQLMDKSYPEFKYRPDHARTEDFNGSREIMAYFDCPIDRGYTLGDLKNILEKIIKSPTDKNLTNEAKTLLSKEQNASKRYLSEDYAFCYNAQRIGISIWLCPWIPLNHTGTYTYGGSLIDLLTIGANATIDQETSKKFKNKE